MLVERKKELFEERLAICLIDSCMDRKTASETTIKQIKDLRKKENEKNIHNGQ